MSAKDSPFDPAAKLLRHPAHVAALLSEDPDAWRHPPLGVEVSPTNSCNARCPWCFYVSSEYKQRHSAEEMDRQTCAELISSLVKMGVKSLTWTGGGEPSTYTHIDEMIEHGDAMHLRMGMFTNGYAPIEHPEYLDWIRITVTEKFVLTKNVARYAEATDVGVNFNVTNDNQREMRRLLEEAIAAGAKYFQVRPALADRWDLQERVAFPEWVSQYEDRIRIEVTGYKWRDYLKPHGYDVCRGHRLVPFVWHDGRVSVCAYHKKNPAYDFGDLREQTFEEIWAGERRRKMVEDGVAVVPDCQHCCKLHEVNKLLAHAPAHLEFV